MDKRKIVIKVSNDFIYFNPKFSIPIQATNVPKKYLSFRTKDEIFWLVDMINYDKESKVLNVKICNYKASDTSSFEEQKPTKEIAQLIFESFDWNEFEPLLMRYQVSAFKNQLTNYEDSPYFNSDTISFPKEQISNSKNKDIPYYMDIILPKHIVKEEFRISFSESTFKSGYIEFSKFSKKLKRTYTFSIKNEHILAEFENIKHWFSKRLKIKKFKVYVEFKLEGENVLEINTTSPQIEKINPELIDGVKYQRTISLIKEPRQINPDKSLFTTADIFDQFDQEDSVGNVFNQSEQDLLDFFIENKQNIRNKNQLTFLSRNLQSVKQKMRYTLNPNFGFLFFVEGKNKNHFIWELLNSHATYIWSFEKNETSISIQYSRVEGIINMIRINGRDTYKNEYRNKGLDNDIAFIVIYHDLKDYDTMAAFSHWKSKLDEQLV
mgnify:CR=1 FL=1